MSHNEGGSQTGCAWLRLQSSIYMAESINKDGLFHLPPLMLRLLKREKMKVGGWMHLPCSCMAAPVCSVCHQSYKSDWAQFLIPSSLLHPLWNGKFRLLVLLCQQRSLRYHNPLSNKHEIMRQRDAQCLQGEGVALQLLALPAWLASLSVRGG